MCPPLLLQVAHLDILAKLYILRYQYADAAAVYETLAMRQQGLGDEAVDLPERVELYRSAVLQVRASSCMQNVLSHEIPVVVVIARMQLILYMLENCRQRMCSYRGLRKLLSCSSTLRETKGWLIWRSAAGQEPGQLGHDRQARREVPSHGAAAAPRQQSGGLLLTGSTLLAALSPPPEC